MALVDANIRCTRLEKSLGRHVSLLQIEFLDRFSLFQIPFSSVVCICTQQDVIDDISLHEQNRKRRAPYHHQKDHDKIAAKELFKYFVKEQK